MAVAAVKGSLMPYLGEGVNYVNAERIAGSRGIEVVRSTHSRSADYPHLVGVTLSGDEGSFEICGTVFGERDSRVVRFGGYPLEFRPAGRLLVLRNDDRPGVVGKLGMLLGEGGVNIADIHLARQKGESDAVAVLRLDVEPPAPVLDELRGLPEVRSVHVVDLGRR